MKVRIYAGSSRIVEKSGVGQAIHHQEEMLRRMGAAVTSKNEFDVDMVHINTVFPDSVLAAVRAKRRGQFVICYGHSTIEDFRNSFKFSNRIAPLFLKWIRFCYSRGDIIITPTEYSRKLLLSYGIDKPIIALSNGVDTDFFRPRADSRRDFRSRYGLSEDDKVVVTAGHFIERKGILEYIELARKLPEVRFFWFGTTSPKLITSEVREAMENKPDNLEFPGFVSQAELRDAYCGSDLFCFMSREETEGIVVLEALASGVPVLVRDIPVYEGWLEHGKNVWKAGSEEEFLQLTKGVVSGSLPDLTVEGRKVAEARSLENIGNDLLSIYQRAEEAAEDAAEEPAWMDAAERGLKSEF
jgi:1,2-diacylglycerol-3-alpha-glucose alpha-1,2-glucosyltransferase